MEEAQLKSDDRTLWCIPFLTVGPSPLSHMGRGGGSVGSRLLLTFLCECRHKKRKEKEVH